MIYRDDLGGTGVGWVWVWVWGVGVGGVGDENKVHHIIEISHEVIMVNRSQMINENT